MGMNVRRAEQVQAKLIRGTKVLLIWPTGEHDRTAYEVKRYRSKSSGWVNLWDLLGPEGLTVESGCRELYEVHYTPRPVRSTRGW